MASHCSFTPRHKNAIEKLYLFGYVIAILCLVGLSIMCCSITCVLTLMRDKIKDISFGSES